MKNSFIGLFPYSLAVVMLNLTCLPCDSTEKLLMTGRPDSSKLMHTEIQNTEEETDNWQESHRKPGDIYGSKSDTSPPDYSGIPRNMSKEKELLLKLMKNYERIGKRGRPVLNIHTPVKVKFHLALIQMDLDERAKILTTSVWARHTWRDEYMTWSPADYDGITIIRVEPESIWIPDITLYNTADAVLDTSNALAMVDYNGTVTWFPHTIMRSSCSVDVRNFPFDSQECHMWFGSWTHPLSEVDLQMIQPPPGSKGTPGLDLQTFQSDYKESCAWDITKVDTNRRVRWGGSNQTSFVFLTFDLVIERKLVFSSYILTLPCIFLACLTLVVFWLPPERPDRTGLAMSTFSSFMVLLLILVEAAPPTASSIPTLGVYYCFNMVIIMLSIILSSMVVNISRGRHAKIPHWLSWMTAFMQTRSPGGVTEAGNAEERLRMLTPSPVDNDIYSSSINSLHLSDTSRLLLKGLEQHLGDIKRVLIKMDHRMHGAKPSNQQEPSDWLVVALGLDRYFFGIYVVLITVSLFVLFPKPANWW